MDTKTNVARSVPSTAVSVEHLTDAELLAGTRRLVGRSNQLLAELLAHLAEVETRGIHRARACSSLYTYCIYELRFSEDEAFRRVAAARLVKRFPALLGALASGELHLTGLLMLGPHLTESNLTEVLASAKHRTKREIGRLVRVLDPLPAVPACIEPLGPAPARHFSGAPSWADFVRATCPVRELEPGERPRDWMASENDAGAGSGDESANEPDSSRGDTGTSASEPAAPQRYKVQFTATEEYVALVDEAKALLSHAVRNPTLDDIQLRAMRAFVAALKKQKYATKSPTTTASELRTPASNTGTLVSAPSRSERRPTIAEHAPSEDSADLCAEEHAEHPRRRGRHVPAAVRRAVYERDGARCTYLDAAGRRCPETRRLEFHHVTPFARDGAHTPSNITLRCAAHNALAAEEDFGRDRIELNKSPDYEPFSAAGASAVD